MTKHAVISFSDGTKCYSGPNCLRHSGKAKLSPEFSHKSVPEQLEEMAALKNPLSGSAPKDIDTTLAGIYNAYAEEAVKVKGLDKEISSLKQRIDSYPEGSRWKKNAEDAMPSKVKLRAKYDALAQEILEEAVPYEAEFRRRGGWTRAFLVRNSNGHVHKNRSCPTTFPTTQYAWLPDYSGGDEAKVVDDAGESACTVCYPSAPAESLRRPSRIGDPEVMKMRSERDKKRNEKAISDAEKSITNPDGSELSTRYYGHIKTARTAEIQAVSTFSDLKAFDEGIRISHNPEYLAEQRADYNILVKALANKNNITVPEQEELIKVKGMKKFKSEWLQ